jgi:hypothetical protein
MGLEGFLEFAILIHRVSNECRNSDETLPSSIFQAFCPVLRSTSYLDGLLS